MNKIYGIYKIVNKKNGKLYIGKSKNVKKRWAAHKSLLKNNRNLPNPHLQNAWNKWGEECFDFLIIEICFEQQLKQREEYWINYFQSYDREKGYNKKIISDGVEHHSEETKKRISEAGKGRRHSEETKRKLSQNNARYWKGRKLSKTTRKKISDRQKGENHNLYGKHHTEKTKHKMSLSSIGENNSQSKLTWKQVKEIREKYVPKVYLQKTLAKEYNVSQSTIKDVINNKVWKEESKKNDK